MKHSSEVKLAAVNHYLADHAGIISTTKLFQLSHTNLSYWINFFLLHGPWALDYRHKRNYSLEDKLYVVLYALGYSEPLPRITARFNTPSHSTVKNWEKSTRSWRKNEGHLELEVRTPSVRPVKGRRASQKHVVLSAVTAEG